MNETRIISIWASDLPSPHAALGCRRCDCSSGYLARYVKADKRTSIRWVCDNCEDYGTGSDLPHSILDAHGCTIYDLPKRADRSNEDGPPCVVCGDTPAQVHHWAPVAIFPHWPGTLGEYLCQVHHDDWHKRMRACGLRWPHELAR